MYVTSIYNVKEKTPILPNEEIIIMIIANKYQTENRNNNFRISGTSDNGECKINGQNLDMIVLIYKTTIQKSIFWMR